MLVAAESLDAATVGVDQDEPGSRCNLPHPRNRRGPIGVGPAFGPDREEQLVVVPAFGRASGIHAGGADTGSYGYDDGSTDTGTDPNYDPNLYEAPPQEEPEVAPPAEEVAPAPDTGAPPEGGAGGGATPGDG